MNTDKLVTLLARGGAAPAGPSPAARFALATLIAAAAALGLMAATLGLRADLAQATHQPMFWVKAGFGVAVALLAWPLGLRLARPGMRAGWWPAGIVTIFAGLWVLAIVALAGAETGRRTAMLLRSSWLACPLLITALSVPGFVAILRASASLAPTRPALAGAAAGMLSAAIAAAAYALHCPELDAPFIAAWYELGLLIPTLAGALLGPRLLRW